MDYVHGYSPTEAGRLQDQSNLLSRLFFPHVHYQSGERVLEAGCGIGAQTRHLLRSNPGIVLTSLDISKDSLRTARANLLDAGFSGLNLMRADLNHLPFSEETFDRIFVCFVLEHLVDPLTVLRNLKSVLKPGCEIMVIEGDHGSCFFYPESPEAWHVWHCLVEAQKRLGGDSLIGRRLYPLLHQAGFCNIRVIPQFIYADAGRPEWVEGFTIKTIVAMVEGVKQRALDLGLTDRESWSRGITALRRTAQSPDGVFCYTFFQAIASA